MQKIILMFFCITAYFAIIKANATETMQYENATDNQLQYINDGIIYYYCDAKSSSFSFNANTLKSPHFDKNMNKVNIIKLLKTSKEDIYGDSLRLGSKKAVRRCGDIKLVFESGFYNSNPQGMLGLMDYPILSVYINNKKIIDKHTLNLCNSGEQRQKCPDEPAIESLSIEKESKNLYKLTLIKAVPQDTDNSFTLEKSILRVK